MPKPWCSVPNGGARLDHVELLARREDVALSGKVKSIAVTEGGVTLAGVDIEGAGGPISGSLTLSPSSLGSARWRAIPI